MLMLVKERKKKRKQMKVLDKQWVERRSELSANNRVLKELQIDAPRVLNFTR